MLETFTRETFAPHQGERFRLEREAGDDLELTLIEVTDLSQRGATWGAPGAVGAPGPSRAPFSVLFRGPPAPVLAQRIYRLEHSRIGAFELFLVPIGPDGSGMRYEAVFA